MFSPFSQQPPYNQQYPQPQQSSFGGIFGPSSFFGGSERLNPQTIQQIVLQLQQQRIPPMSVSKVEQQLHEMVQKGTEKISNVLKQFISPELSQQVLSNIELEEIEEDITGRRSVAGRPGYDTRASVPGSVSYIPHRSTGVDAYGNPYPGAYDRRTGGKKRSTRRHRQRGGGYSDNMPSYGSNASTFKGGRRHKKHTKSCRH